LTFREYVTDDRETRPGSGLQLYANPGCEVDENGHIGQLYENLERPHHKNLTQFLLADFYRQLNAAKASPALDYLKESFEQILRLPAWTVRGPRKDREARMLKGDRIYLVEGEHVADEFLDALVDAGERYLAAELPSSHGTPATVPKRRTGRPQKGENKGWLVIGALAKHHGYQPGGNIENWTPAATKKLAQLASGKHVKVSQATVSRFFKEKFPNYDRGYDGYVAACNRNATMHIGLHLAIWQCDVPERLAALFPNDGAKTDPDPRISHNPPVGGFHRSRATWPSRLEALQIVLKAPTRNHEYEDSAEAEPSKARCAQWPRLTLGPRGSLAQADAGRPPT
jgi:hypothetical protein